LFVAGQTHISSLPLSIFFIPSSSFIFESLFSPPPSLSLRGLLQQRLPGQIFLLRPSPPLSQTTSPTTITTS
jgi:hypothetical protein